MKNVVSLFAGIGGFELAFQRAGIPTVASVEIDKQARGVLAHHFPHTTLFDDVREVTGDDLRSVGFAGPDGGVLVGGFPCQDLSTAGARAGMQSGSGTRSALWWEFHRLIGDTHPEWVIAENVPGLLSSRGGRDMGALIGSLEDLGYGYAWRVLDAQFFGVPQRRRRVFIVARRDGDGQRCAQVLLDR